MAGQVFIRIYASTKNHARWRTGSYQPPNSVASGRHQRHCCTPRAVLCRAAYRPDAHIVSDSRREVRQDDAPCVGKNTRFRPRAGAGGELYLIRLGIDHGLQIDRQLCGDGIIQREDRLGQWRWRGICVDDVKAGRQDWSQTRVRLF
jgi:hypothetical protein